MKLVEAMYQKMLRGVSSCNLRPVELLAEGGSECKELADAHLPLRTSYSQEGWTTPWKRNLHEDG